MSFSYFEENLGSSFPKVETADENGILAIGGDLSPDRLLEAYQQGIFPWYNEDEPIIWWSPDPRFVIFPAEIKISSSMKKILSREIFRITYDQAFAEVIKFCGQPRKEEEGTWLTAEMLEAYLKLFELGYAHSVEAWQGDQLVGGLYGVSLGSCFFGESMFHKVPNASKAAFISFGEKLAANNFRIIDCQVYSDHLKSLGAREIPRKEFMKILNQGLSEKNKMWS